VVADDFRLGARGWEAGFADYSTLNTDMQLDSGIRDLPPEIGVTGTGFFISGMNNSDDLFMFLTRKLTAADGVRANQRYNVSFRIKFDSQAGLGCAGIGGGPGDVFLKAGASGEQPRVTLLDNGDFRLSVDKGQQSTGGPAATVAGTIENGTSNCSSSASFVSLEKVHQHSFVVTANGSGEIWLLVGTDSGFEAKTTLYYQSITATLTLAP
jgi:hypothetical protein